jgi:hypothetical protein
MEVNCWADQDFYGAVVPVKKKKKKKKTLRWKQFPPEFGKGIGAGIVHSVSRKATVINSYSLLLQKYLHVMLFCLDCLICIY